MAPPTSSPPSLFRRSPRRVLLIAAGLLAAFEGLLRLTLPPDARVLSDPMNPYGCMRDEELGQLVLARRRGGPRFDVVLLGDSVLSSVNNRPGHRVADYLGPLLSEQLRGVPGADQVFVWNLGSGGARAADQYASLRRLLGKTRPAQDLMVVFSSNVIFFSRRHMSPPMLYPCLGEALRDDPEARALLRLPSPAPALERRLVELVTRKVYLFQQRRRLAEMLFGGPPREALRNRLILFNRAGSARRGEAQRTLPAEGGRERPPLMDDEQPWFARGLSAAQYAPNYDFVPLSSDEAVNHRMSGRLARFLGERGDLPSFVFLTPQNHALLASLADNPAYHELSRAIIRTFEDRGVPSRSYDGLISDELFSDLDHLTPAGNRQLAERLAADLSPRIRDILLSRAAR